MITRPTLVALAAAISLTACQNTLSGAGVTRLEDGQLNHSHDTPPPGTKPGTCWGTDVTPAVVETVTEQVLLQPAQVTSDGSVIAPALYKTETQQRIVRERREIWFETPCDSQMDAEFIATLQRALQARGHYRGPISGEVNTATKRAVRRYQSKQGLDSGILSMAAARQLGIVDYDFNE